MFKHVVLHRMLKPFFKIKSFKTNRKIVVIESDDWGAMTVPTLDIYNELIRKGLNLEKSHYTRFDTLEDVTDLDALYTVLSKYKDSRGRSPIVTMNFIMANPDYQAIKESGFTEYRYECLNETYRRFGKGDVLDKVKSGMQDGLVYPQLHGREHLNVSLWLRYLRDSFTPIRLAFDYEMFAVTTGSSGIPMESVKRSLFSRDEKELIINKEQITDAQKIFEKTFGFKSQSFVAPNYCWNPTLELTMYENGIKYLQSSYIQTYCDLNTGKLKEKWHYLGQRNSQGMLFSVRNVKFEPSEREDDITDKTLRDISVCFSNNQPAIISCHRVNFNGGLQVKNRDKSLSQLDKLLKELIKTYPDVEFLSSEELFNIM